MSWLEVSSEVSLSEEEEKRKNVPFFLFLLDMYKTVHLGGVFPHHHKFFFSFFGRI